MIAAAATIITAALASLGATRRVDDVIYDSLYRLRAPEDKSAGPVVIVAVDDASLEAVGKALHFGWPWPREFWGRIVQYLETCGARAVAIDLLFDEPSNYQSETGDDDAFAALMNEVNIPVVYAAYRAQPTIAPPIRDPALGYSDIPQDEEILRSYQLQAKSVPSLALRTARAVDPSIRGVGSIRLHYYGPHRREDGKPTFRQISAANVLAAARGGEAAAKSGIDPAMFRDKIVLIGAVARGAYDLKATPLSPQYPGVEYHATAIQNLLANQFVNPLTAPLTSLLAFLAALLSAASLIMLRRLWLKFAGALLPLVGLIVLAAMLFRATQIRWVPLAMPLLAALLAGAGAFLWVYLTEFRQRQFIFRALGQYVSPQVAARIADDPASLSLGGERRHMTVMFSDIEGFTDLGETMEVESLGRLLNSYMDRMSEIVIEHEGTLGKYLGDGIMSFWNAPIAQPHHATLACRAALAMLCRGDAPGTPALRTRLGISSGPMVVGNMGSSRRFDYTVIGDTVNFASRLESANKHFGTRILVSQGARNQVGEHFILRKVGLLRVKGRRGAEPVYELIGEAPPDEATAGRVRAYERALESFQSRQWDAAKAVLLEILKQHGDDGPSRVLLARVAAMRITPPAQAWDGSISLEEK
jgi:adenylate cyclase